MLAGSGALLAVAGGVATNRVQGAWWVQLLWFAGAVVAVLMGGRLSLISDRAVDSPAMPEGDLVREFGQVSGGVVGASAAVGEGPDVAAATGSLGGMAVGKSSGGVTAGPGADFRGAHFYLTDSSQRVTSGGRSPNRGLLAPPLGRLPKQVRGRDEVLSRLSQLMSAPDGRVHLLVGLGGTGKSTVALRVAERANEQNKPVWWVSAADAASLTSALLDLAQGLGADPGEVYSALKGRRNPADVLWQCLEECSGWLLVIDNADDVAALSIGGHPVRDGNGWLRPTRAGLVVVTSRDSDARHWGQHVTIHPVGWLSDDNGARVLVDLAPRAGSTEDARALSARLGGLALALHQAGSHLTSGFAREQTFTDYREALEKRFTALLRADADDREAVTSTWKLSLDQLAANRVPQARALLEVFAWFAGAVPILIELLDYGVLAQFCGEPGGDGVAAGLEALRSVGLIESRTTGTHLGTSILVHPLVAETTRSLATSDAPKPRSVNVAIDVFVAARRHLDPQEPHDWPRWMPLLPHLDELLTHTALMEEAALGSLASSTAVTAMALVWAGSYLASEELAVAALNRTQRLGPDHDATLTLRFRRATARAQLGRFTEAETEYREILKHEQRGPRPHLNALTTRRFLAAVLSEQGKHDKAESLFRSTLKKQQRALGADHPNTLYTRHNLAIALSGQDKHAEAEPLLRDTLNDQQRVLGPDHPATLAASSALGLVLLEQGKYAEAEILLHNTLNDQRRLLGTHHPRTLETGRAVQRLEGIRRIGGGQSRE